MTIYQVAQKLKKSPNKRFARKAYGGQLWITHRIGNIVFFVNGKESKTEKLTLFDCLDTDWEECPDEPMEIETAGREPVYTEVL